MLLMDGQDFISFDRASIDRTFSALPALATHKLHTHEKKAGTEFVKVQEGHHNAHGQVQY